MARWLTLRLLVAAALLAVVACLQTEQTSCGTLSCSSGKPRYSFHSCYGETAKTRSCIFRNLYYHVATKKYVYFECPEDPMRVKLAGQTHSSYEFGIPDPNQDPYFFTKDFLTVPSDGWSGWTDFIPFNVEIRRTSTLPEESSVFEADGLSVVWYFFMQSSFSYGHCVLNDWFSMYLAISNHLPKIPKSFRVLALWHLNHEPKVCSHYLEDWSKQPVHHFHRFTNSTGKEWVRFCDLLIGDGGIWPTAFQAVSHKNTQLPDGPTMFSSLNWKLFRDSIYNIYGFNPDDLSSETVITVLDKTSKDRRRILNVPELVAHLKNKFPFATVTSTTFTNLKPIEQVALMKRTSVFIAPQGSASFRFIFLSPGARVIYIGTPMDDEGPSPNNWNWTPFFEVPRYFTMAHFKFIKYPINMTLTDQYVIDKKGPSYGQHWYGYQSSVYVDLPRMENLVAQAIWEHRAEVQWRTSM